MMRLFHTIVLCVLFLVFAGCSKEQTESFLSATSAELPIKEEEIIQLIVEGTQHYWHVSSGGEMTQETYQTFEYNGVPYRYFGEVLQIKEKLESFLNEVFTQKARNE
jgi:hypothetical protein